jgi:hypothetical protein
VGPWGFGGFIGKKLLVTRTDRRCITEAGDPIIFAKKKNPWRNCAKKWRCRSGKLELSGHPRALRLGDSRGGRRKGGSAIWVFSRSSEQWDATGLNSGSASIIIPQLKISASEYAEWEKKIFL